MPQKPNPFSEARALATLAYGGGVGVLSELGFLNAHVPPIVGALALVPSAALGYVSASAFAGFTRSQREILSSHEQNPGSLGAEIVIDSFLSGVGILAGVASRHGLDSFSFLPDGVKNVSATAIGLLEVANLGRYHFVGNRNGK